ncbi:MAG: rhodanese-like domain-containing protein [Pseudomonadota bacterium]
MGFTNIDANVLEGLQASGARVVDVRTTGEIARGVIPGASHIALSELPTRLTELGDSAPIVLYCQVGGRSAGAAQFLVAQGFKQVYNLQGGINAWAATGRPIENLM